MRYEEPEEEKIEFIEIAGIAHQGCFYAILEPVELIEGMADDEALVFKVSRLENGEDKFEIELDDEVIDAVFADVSLDSRIAKRLHANRQCAHAHHGNVLPRRMAVGNHADCNLLSHVRI